MICPTCKTHIPDGSVRCPACHASVAMTIAMPALQGRWCPSCGAGVGWDDQVCPHCGMPLESSWETPTVHSEAPAHPVTAAPEEVGEETPDADDTHAIPRIESAIPAEDDPTSKVKIHDEMPHAGRLMLASVASALLVCGLALVITHPWNPNQYSISATTEADTSMAGFPGTVESLSGQDGDESDAKELTGDEATLAQLKDAYEKLGSYAKRADESESLFAKVGYKNDQEARRAGKREIDALAIDVSNLIEALGQIDVTSGTYAEEQTNLTTLGNWLRNRVDVLQTAWKSSAESTNPASKRDELEALLLVDHNADGVSAYKALFDENYEAWAPEKK